MITAQRKVTGHRKFLKDFGIDSDVLDWLEVSDMEKLRELIDDVMLGEDRKYKLDVVSTLAELIAEHRKVQEKLINLIDSLVQT